MVVLIFLKEVFGDVVSVCYLYVVLLDCYWWVYFGFWFFDVGYYMG